MDVKLMEFWPRILDATLQTLQMVGFSLAFSLILGLPLGIILVITRPGNLYGNKPFFNVLNGVINFLRSIPFIILLVAIIPFTRLLIGTTIGTAAAIVPLVVFAAPYIARLVESSLLEVSPGVIEAAEAMGAKPWQIIFRVMVPEAFSSLILNITIATIGIVGASAMAGFVGGGGLGDLAIAYGYQRFETDIMIVTVLLLVLIVQLIQSLGNTLSKTSRRR
ncbi:ABC transporter permease [Gracilibacillus caseinilyticus]|uniref:ABC transporter permease n=1 Tax=Gracilibacillus caseinilyticus TaxID=2932256 RepID=A0ABY4F322_9BACI|nr:methionine ABC transporter permease [Gracilibacillus caseinilyticus]UOQ50462.1 ABC transporter permease [Gracilibacillus caseinilyticus]